MAEDETNTGEEVVPEVKQKAAVPWIPLVLVLLFIPIITLVLVEFVVIPKLKNSLANATTDTSSELAADHAAPVVEDHGGGGGHDGGGGGHGGEAEATAVVRGTTVTFEDIISNVAGTMGTRFLKVSFQIVSKDPELAGIVRMRDAQVRDAVISTLSSRTIQEIEIIGGRNALRVALISSINGAIGMNMVEDLYFLDFIIQ